MSKKLKAPVLARSPKSRKSLPDPRNPITPHEHEELEVWANEIRAVTGKEFVSRAEIEEFKARWYAEALSKRKENAGVEAKRRGDNIQAIIGDLRTGRTRLSLYWFLRILLHDQVRTEIETACLSGDRRDEHAQQVAALAEALESLSRRKKVVVPPFLEGMFDLAALRQATKDHLADVKAAQAKSPLTKPNWHMHAELLLIQKKRGQEMTVATPYRPWQRLVSVVIGSCATPGLDESAVREWLARDKGYSEASPFGAELARLNRDDRLLADLLEELKQKFPKEAEAWFGNRQDSTRDGKVKSQSAKESTIARNGEGTDPHGEDPAPKTKKIKALNDTHRAIITACKRKAYKCDVLAIKVHRNRFHVRRECGKLIHDGYLERIRNEGYRTLPMKRAT